MTSHDDRTREIAYSLWEGDGHPQGRDKEFWCRAECIAELESASKEPSPNRSSGLTLSPDACDYPQCRLPGLSKAELHRLIASRGQPTSAP
jgi:hypothetical protein